MYFDFYISPGFDVQSVKSDDVKKLYRARRVVSKRGFAVSPIYNDNGHTIRYPYRKLTRPSYDRWRQLETNWLDLFNAKWPNIPNITHHDFGYKMIRSMTTAACEFYAD